MKKASSAKKIDFLNHIFWILMGDCIARFCLRGAWKPLGTHFDAKIVKFRCFLGPRGPHGLPSLVSPSVSPQEKIGSHLYRLICLMNHQKSHQTNPVQSSTVQYSLVPPSTV